MSGDTPAQKLANIRKTITDAKREERKAIRELPREQWKRDYQWRQGRVLSGSKTVDVEVDFEIEKEDLEALGYHHEDDCQGISVTGGNFTDDRQELSDWHDKTHGLTLWQSCPYEPCKILSLDYRSTQ